MALASFTMQQQLARILNEDDRKNLWESRAKGEWTLTSLREAVDDYMTGIGSTVMPKVKKAGCVAKFGKERTVKANVELTEELVRVRLTVSGAELGDMKFKQVSKGIYELDFTW